MNALVFLNSGVLEWVRVEISLNSILIHSTHGLSIIHVHPKKPLMSDGGDQHIAFYGALLELKIPCGMASPDRRIVIIPPGG